MPPISSMWLPAAGPLELSATAAIAGRVDAGAAVVAGAVAGGAVVAGVVVVAGGVVVAGASTGSSIVVLPDRTPSGVSTAMVSSAVPMPALS